MSLFRSKFSRVSLMNPKSIMREMHRQSILSEGFVRALSVDSPCRQSERDTSQRKAI